MTIQAIETRYAGCRFRSRLEARWAVFFDTLGIPWEYEPEGFDLDGLWYLPDFWLPQHRAWLEVKGQGRDRSKWDRLFSHLRAADPSGYMGMAEAVDLGDRLTHQQPIPTRTFLISDIPRPDAHTVTHRAPYSSKTFVEGDYAFGIMLGPGSPHSGWGWGRCHACDTVEIGHVAFPTPLTCGHFELDFIDADIRDGYAAARSARFDG